MEPLEEIPGVTFHVEHAERTETRGVVTLHCDVHDGDVWDAVLQKLDSYRVYTVTQLHEAVTEVIKARADRTQASLEKDLYQLKQANARLVQDNSVLEASNREYIRANAAWARHHRFEGD